MSEAADGVGIDLTPPSFLQRRREGEETQSEPEMVIDKVPTLEELIVLIKEKVRQRDALNEVIGTLNRYAEKMLRELSKPRK